MIRYINDLWVNGWSVLCARWYLRHSSHLGKKVRLWGHPSIRNNGQMIIHDRVRLVSTVAKLELVAEHGGCLEIGEGTFINYGCSIAANQLIRIGSGCSIGTHGIIIDNNYHSLDPERRNVRPPSAPIILEDNVWLGARVIVLCGVTIGTGSVIGAGSVVTRSVPPRSVAAGIPARVVKEI